MAGARGRRRGQGAAQGCRAVDLLRGAADSERPPRPPSRLGPRLQGPLPPLPDDAGPRRPPQGRLGLPRASRRDRGREGARAHQQARDRGVRCRRVHAALPRLRVALRRGLGRADRAIRRLDRHEGRVLDAVQRVHRIGLVDHPPDVGQGPRLRGPPGHARTARAAAPRCRATRSAQGYQDVVDPSVFVRFPITSGGPTEADLLVWTTTPWTLVSNVAVAAGPDIVYVQLRGAAPGRDLVLAEAARRPPLRRRRGRSRRPLHRPRPDRAGTTSDRSPTCRSTKPRRGSSSRTT